MYDTLTSPCTGGGGGAHPARAPPKIGKNMIFWRKIVIFHTKYPNNFRASLRNWKKYDFFWRKIVIFHTKYQKKISRLPPLGAIFDVRPPLQLEILDPPLVYSVTDIVQKIGQLTLFKLF
jgi:hypothetical protein